MKKLKFQTFISSPDSIQVSFKWKDLNRETAIILSNVKAEIERKLKNQLLYSTTAFDTILLKLKPNSTDIIDFKKEIEDILCHFNLDCQIKNNFKTYEIPVCYEPFGKDLVSLSKHSGLTIDEIIEIHSEKLYTIHVIGFLPGFLYMGNVDPKIEMPRLKKPRLMVEKGSVGIAENQTGIYPNNSPGGWQIIGRTPINIFNVDEDPPSRFKPGDQVKFTPINKEYFDCLINETEIELKTL
jgi:inhibitor of KinA